MEIIINWWILVGVSVLVFVIGALWYSPLIFGNTWMKIMGMDKHTKEELKKMEKEMTKFYILQFFLTLLTSFVLYMNIKWLKLGADSALWFAFFMWLGYIMPAQVCCVIWGNTAKKWWTKQIAILVSGQLVSIFVAAYIFSNF